MEIPKKNKVVDEQRTLQLDGLFSPLKLDSAPTFWKSRRRKKSANTQNLDRDNSIKVDDEDQETPTVKKFEDSATATTPEKHYESLTDGEKPAVASVLSEKRKALFEPLQPINGKRPSPESLLPPPDFDSAIYPQGWLIGKKRKLVNVDVVESMRRIAVQEMNRKDREIDGLNEQLEEDAKCLEHLQVQLLEEKSKRTDVERQNTILQNQINLLMDMLQGNGEMDDDGSDQH